MVFLKPLMSKFARNKKRIIVGELSFLLIVGISAESELSMNSYAEQGTFLEEPPESTFTQKLDSQEEPVKKKASSAGKSVKSEAPSKKPATKKTSLTHTEIKKIESVVGARDEVEEEPGKDYNSVPPQKSPSIDSSYRINMNYILQNPELPTGCEATSLTMVLNFLGYHVSKTTIAGEYLPTSTDFSVSDGKKYGPDFSITFPGDPFTKYGYGCLAPCIVTTANNYLSDYGTGHTIVSNISGSSPAQLYDYVKKGVPIIVWATISMCNPRVGASWYTPSGKYVTWTSHEHCLVLVGYDNNNVILNDPLVGTATYSRSLFETRYAQMGSQAVILENHDGQASSGGYYSESSSSQSSAVSKPDSSSTSHSAASTTGSSCELSSGSLSGVSDSSLNLSSSQQ